METANTTSRSVGRTAIKGTMRPYSELSDAVEQALPEHGIFVRDITVSGSLWGSRLLKATQPMHNIHSLAGAIGLYFAIHW